MTRCKEVEKKPGEKKQADQRKKTTTSWSQRVESITVTLASQGIKIYTNKYNYVSVVASKLATTPHHFRTQIRNKIWQPNLQTLVKSTVNSKQQGNKILFSCELSSKQMSEADLILVSNSVLQIDKKEFKIWFFPMKYILFGVISAFITE